MICQEYDKKIQTWISENRERMIDMWLDLVRMPSVRSEPAPGAPFGVPCAQALTKLMDGYYGVGLGVDFEEPGFGKLTCTNGMVKVEDGKLCVSVDIRYGAGMPGDKLEALLDKAWGEAGWKLTYRENHHGAKVDPDSPIPALLTQVTCQVTGEEYKPYWMMAGTYSRHLQNTYTIGSRIHDPNSQAVVPEMPAGHGGAHQRDEYCIVDDWILGVRLLTHCILACDREINS